MPHAFCDMRLRRTCSPNCPAQATAEKAATEQKVISKKPAAAPPKKEGKARLF